MERIHFFMIRRKLFNYVNDFTGETLHEYKMGVWARANECVYVSAVLP